MAPPVTDIEATACAAPPTVTWPANEARLGRQVSETKSTTSASRRRDKPHLSCALCRKRKLRCDRKQPCSSCASRDLVCTYVPGGDGIAAPTLHDRLLHLERLIKLQIPASKETETAAAPSYDIGMAVGEDTSSREPVNGGDVPAEHGRLHIAGSDSRYVGGEHWAAILESITDFRDQLEKGEERALTEPSNTSSSLNAGEADPALAPPARRALLLYACPRPASRDEILAALPPKVTVDRYLSRYFTYLELASCTIHSPTFLQEYEAFWANPSGAPMIWISLLFGILSLVITTLDVAEASPGIERNRALRQVHLFVEKTVQCLVLGQYTKPGPYVVESVVHYMHVEFAISVDANEDAWFLLALAVKIAMSMGYHRDPRYFSKLTPLQSEMRRRVWATLLQGDILISGQMGMPRIISDAQWDTAEPRNLNDSDMDATMTQLPASRPEVELTSSLGIIARIRMLKVVGKIADLTSAVAPCSYSEITQLDGMLRDARNTIPKLLQPKPLAASVTDSSQVIMARLFISQIFYKGQIMLHRRFLYLDPSPQEQTSYTNSRNVCLDAALGLLDIQRVMDEETGPTGQLHMMRWRLSSSLNHQFLTATMILCSLLYRNIVVEREADIIAALQGSRDIWIRNCDRSREARKAASITSLVLEKALENDTRNLATAPKSTVMGDECVQNFSWPAQSFLGNLSPEMDFDPSQMLEELGRPDAGVPFQPDLFEGYTPPMMQSQAPPILFPNGHDTPEFYPPAWP